MPYVLSLIVQANELAPANYYYHPLQITAWLANIAGFIVAISAIFYTVRQYRLNTIANQANAAVNRARFWLDIRKMFADHEYVHENLQKGGDWYQSDTEPSCPKDRAKVVSYLSLLEQVKFMLNRGLIDRDTLDATLIPYRVRLLLQNGVIKRCLLHGEHKDKYPDWEEFKDGKSDWVWFEELVNYFDDRYYKSDHYNSTHKFPYRAMFESARGGAPETALADRLVDAKKYARENEIADSRGG